MVVREKQQGGTRFVSKIVVLKKKKSELSYKDKGTEETFLPPKTVEKNRFKNKEQGEISSENENFLPPPLIAMRLQQSSLQKIETPAIPPSLT